MGLTIGNNYNSLQYSTNNTIKSTSETSQEATSENSTKSSSSDASTLNNTLQFIMEDGIATGAYVDGIKMSLTDIFLTSKSQLKENINKEYNKTDVEKLEEIFGL